MKTSGDPVLDDKILSLSSGEIHQRTQQVSEMRLDDLQKVFEKETAKTGGMAML